MGGDGGPPCIVGLAVGYHHACALKGDGTLWCWGANTSGQLGDGTGVTRPSPVQITALGTSVVEVTAEGLHTCARKSDGTLWCWGYNTHGQVGDGTGDGTTPNPKPAPVQVTALGTSVVAVEAAGLHTCARKGDGTLWCWGYNGFGQVGDGTLATPKPLPVQVTALGTSAVEMAGGYGHTCARKGDGTLWCWGDNSAGEVGNGTTTTRELSPVQVTALGTTVVQVTAGDATVCARKRDGTLWCWGYNEDGRVGDGTTATPKPSPVQVASLGTSVVDAAASATHSCAVKGDGTLWCWGANTYGQVGDGTLATPRPSPVQVTSLGTDVAEVGAGSRHTCARKRDGRTIWCWGETSLGQVGDGATSGISCGTSNFCRLSPVTVPLQCP
jgi:alpha-tubulin suppressor-like RCC1 family protein